MNFKFDTLLQTQHSRKDFLLYIGMLLLGIVGMSGFIRRFNRATGKSVQSGYGSTSYGGQ